jgi:hypothetical protein
MTEKQIADLVRSTMDKLIEAGDIEVDVTVPDSEIEEVAARLIATHVAHILARIEKIEAALPGGKPMPAQPSAEARPKVKVSLGRKEGGAS